MSIKPFPGRLWGIAHKIYLTLFWFLVALGVLGLAYAAHSAFMLVTCDPGSNVCTRPDTSDAWIQAFLWTPAAFAACFYRWIRWVLSPSDTARPHPAP